MGLKWVDVSIPLRSGMTVWPGDPPFEIHAQKRIAQGGRCNTSLLYLGTHTGTHVDAPWHFEEAGARLDGVSPDLFFGDALVLDLTDAAHITADVLPRTPLPDRVLFKTGNSAYPDDGPFKTDFVAIEADAAQRLVDDGVKVVGVDYLSVAPYRQSGAVTHHLLLSNGVLVVEGLRLKGLPEGACVFVVLPLPVAGADGAPCRAFIGREE